MDEPTPGDDATDGGDPVDEFEQAYRAAAPDARRGRGGSEAGTDLDTRLARLPDEMPVAPRRRWRGAPGRIDEPLAVDGSARRDDLAVVAGALARLEARLEQLDSSESDLGAVALVRRSHQTLGRKLDGHAEEVMDALHRIERRLTDVERAQNRTAD